MPPIPQACFVPGNTLHVDFPFPAFPDNLGHWAEIMLPAFNVLSQPGWDAATTGTSKASEGRLNWCLLAALGARGDT